MIPAIPVPFALGLLVLAPTGEHVTVAVRCDPEVVRPGGWVDVVVDWSLEPGWHATSPRSRSGQLTVFECPAPRGFEACGRVRATPGRIVHDTTFGEVEEISGRGELRRHFRVPADADGERRIEGSTSWIVCDFERCLPSQSFLFEVKLRVASDGADGPSYADGAVLSDDARLHLTSEGVGVSVRGDVDRIAPGEEFLAILDVAAVGTKEPLDVHVLETGIRGPVKMAGRPWRVVRRAVQLESGKSAARVSLFVPLRAEREVQGHEILVQIPCELAAGRPGPAAEIRLAIDR